MDMFTGHGPLRKKVRATVNHVMEADRAADIPFFLDLGTRADNGVFS